MCASIMGGYGCITRSFCRTFEFSVAFCHSYRVLLTSYHSKKLCFSCTYVRAKPPALHANAHTHEGGMGHPPPRR